MDCGPPDTPVHGILQARILEWVACLPPGDLPHPGIELASLMSPALADGFVFLLLLFFYHWRHLSGLIADVLWNFQDFGPFALC